MSETQIAVAALVWGTIATFYPRAGWAILAISGAAYLTLGWVPFAGWSWSAP